MLVFLQLPGGGGGAGGPVRADNGEVGVVGCDGGDEFGGVDCLEEFEGCNSVRAEERWEAVNFV